MTKLLFLFCFLALTHYASAQYNPADGLEYAYAVALAYCQPNDIMSWTCGDACRNLTGYQPFYSNIFNVSTDQNLSFSMISNPTTERFLFIFRGTVGNVQVYHEIMEDVPVAWKLSNITAGAKVLKYFYNHYENDLRTTFLEKLQEAYKQYPHYTFVFTGHSLGAALTTIACLDVLSSGLIPKEQVILHNYGCPRVGNYEFAQAVEATVPVIYRLTHWKDMAPHIPPCQRNSSGSCVPKLSERGVKDSVFWPAWHYNGQIFYNEANTQYQVCSGDEDRACTDQFLLPQTNMAEHYYYVNVHIACDGTSVTPASVTALEESEIFDRFRKWY